jgi:hypothetical protein
MELSTYIASIHAFVVEVAGVQLWISNLLPLFNGYCATRKVSLVSAYFVLSLCNTMNSVTSLINVHFCSEKLVTGCARQRMFVGELSALEILLCISAGATLATASGPVWSVSLSRTTKGDLLMIANFALLLELLVLLRGFPDMINGSRLLASCQ